MQVVFIRPLGGSALRSKLVLGLLCPILTGGCGAIYVPQGVEAPGRDYGYHRTNTGDVEVIPMTFMNVQEANADGYVPRALPDVFSAVSMIAPEPVSVRAALARAGLDAVDPPLEFALEDGQPAEYDPAIEVLSPALRNENPSAAPVLSLSKGAVDTTLRGGAGYQGSGVTTLGSPGGGNVTQDYGSATNQGGTAYMPQKDEPYGRQGYATATRSSERLADINEALRDAPDLRPVQRQEAQLNPPPDIRPQPYLIGPGDVIGLISRLQPVGTNGGAAPVELADTTKRLRVESNGRIFVPQAGSVNVGGRPLSEAREAIFERLVENELDFDFGIEILEFESKKVSVSGPGGATLLPITLRALTLGEAIAAAGGLGSRPADMVVRVLRGGTIYEVPGRDLITSGDLANRVLIDGDAVYIAPLYDVDSALSFFDQQIRLRDLRQQETDAAIAAEERAIRLEDRDRELLQRAEDRALAAEDRQIAAEDRARNLADSRLNADRARIQFDIEMETYRLESERLRQEAEIARVAAQQAANDSAENARIANITARQAYLDNIRSIQETNRALEAQRRATLQGNASERARARAERRALLELELSEEQDRLDRIVAERERARAAFQAQAQFDSIERDYVFIAGEVNSPNEMEMPLGRSLSLARVILKTGRGINSVSGDPSEIYVIRRRAQGSLEEPLTIYHLDARDATRLALATALEMRPNDVVYVNPQPITNWNRVITQLLPSTGFLGTATSTLSGFGN